MDRKVTNGRSKGFGASAFCRILFSILDWDEDYSYRVPCIVRSRGDETILFFDLDNYIGSAKRDRDLFHSRLRRALDFQQRPHLFFPPIVQPLSQRSHV